jgi:hypothetical protein
MLSSFTRAKGHPELLSARLREDELSQKSKPGEANCYQSRLVSEPYSQKASCQRISSMKVFRVVW